MRRPALLLVLLAPVAVAQAPDVGSGLSLTMDGFAEPAQPLGAAVSAAFVAEASCTLMVGIPPQMSVEFVVAEAPAWATVEVQPPGGTADLSRCDDRQMVRFEGVVTATASDEAPAFTPADVVLTARVPRAQGDPATAEATQPLTAGYVPLLDVRAPSLSASTRAGSPVSFLLQVSNLGNGPTRVSFEVVSADAGLRVTPPAPFVLESGKTGGSETSRSAQAVATWEGDAKEGRSASFTLAARPSYHLDAALAGPERRLGFAVEVQPARAPAGQPAPTATPACCETGSSEPPDDTQPIGEPESKIPGAALPAVLAAMAAGARVRRR